MKIKYQPIGDETFYSANAGRSVRRKTAANKKMKAPSCSLTVIVGVEKPSRFPSGRPTEKITTRYDMILRERFYRSQEKRTAVGDAFRYML